MISKLFYSVRPSVCLGIALLGAASFQDASDLVTITTIFLAVFSGAAGHFALTSLRNLEARNTEAMHDDELPREFIVSSVFTFLLFYVASSIYLGVSAIIICGITLIIFLAYSKVKAQIRIVANLLIALCVALEFVYGALLNNLDSTLIYLIASAFFVTMATDFMSDALDKGPEEPASESSVPLSMSMRKVTIIVTALYSVGTIPLVFILRQNTLFTTFSITMIAVLWLPLLVRFFFPKMDWILFNVSSSHTFYGLMIPLLFLR